MASHCLFDISSPFGRWKNVEMLFVPTAWQSLVWSVPVSNKHLNEPKLCCWQWGANGKVSIFDLLTDEHQLPYKLSR